MYSEKTTIVDVVSLGDDGFSLSITASDLYDAAKSGDVIRRHDISTDAGVHNWAYVGLLEVKLDSNGYTFTFSNGDVFSASLDDDYPASDTVSDETGGGSGGGVLVVNNENGELDKTWNEIDAADAAVIVLRGGEGGATWRLRSIVGVTSYEDGNYYVRAFDNAGEIAYVAAVPDAHPFQE